jgi:hypothetical protein
MRDETGFDLADADSGAGTVVARVGEFSKPRPGGLVGDGKFVSMPESGAGRCFALVEAEIFETGGHTEMF